MGRPVLIRKAHGERPAPYRLFGLETGPSSIKSAPIKALWR